MDKKIEKKCFICERKSADRRLYQFEDEDLALNEKINEVFRIKFDEHRKLKICKGLDKFLID